MCTHSNLGMLPWLQTNGKKQQIRDDAPYCYLRWSSHVLFCFYSKEYLDNIVKLESSTHAQAAQQPRLLTGQCLSQKSNIKMRCYVRSHALHMRVGFSLCFFNYSYRLCSIVCRLKLPHCWDALPMRAMSHRFADDKIAFIATKYAYIPDDTFFWNQLFGRKHIGNTYTHTILVKRCH